MSWNDEGRIICEFSFKCPKVWDRLQTTTVEGVRHCEACDRDVHLAITQEDFRRHAESGRCVAVRVLQPDQPRGKELVYMVGTAGPAYPSPLKKV